jgi:hypothetical protein
LLSRHAARGGVCKTLSDQVVALAKSRRTEQVRKKQDAAPKRKKQHKKALALALTLRGVLK